MFEEVDQFAGGNPEREPVEEDIARADDPDHFASGIEHRSPAVARIDGSVGLNEAKMTKRAVLGAHDSLRHGSFHPQGIADGKHHVTHREVRAKGDGDGMEVNILDFFSIKLEEGEISQGMNGMNLDVIELPLLVTVLGALKYRDGSVDVLFNDMVIRDHVPLITDQESAADARW